MSRLNWDKFKHEGKIHEPADPTFRNPSYLRTQTRLGRMSLADFNASLPRTKQRGEPRAGNPCPEPTGPEPLEGPPTGRTP
jgi:hypothetical protein